ncbi:MAG: MFS transporter [Caldicoprobacterales bacterium]|jgi:DHA3 family macrolide efflux protein-like MFS transporter|nr:MFS transporter [Clostridiales bacterium]
MNSKWDKKVVLFLTTQIISLFGSALVQYAIMWHITLETKSGIMMTVSILCGFLPNFFLSPFAGVWADRYNRKLLIILSDSFIAVTTLITAVVFLSGYEAFWMFFAVMVVRAIGSAAQSPAIGAILPQIVPEDQLTKVNAVNGSLQSFVNLISPMVSGALLTVAEIEVIFFIDVITAAIAVFILMFFLDIPVHAKASVKQTVSYFSDMKAGYHYVKSHDYIKRFFFYSAFFLIFAAPAAFLTPLQVTRTFGEDVWRLTAIEIVFSVGMMLGGLLMASWTGFKNKFHTMVLANVIFGAGTFALGIMPNFWVYLFFMAVIGVAMPMFNTPSMVILQQKVEGDYLGRVFGVMSMLASVMMPLGMLVFGPLADFMPIEYLLFGTGILIILLSFFMWSDKILLEAGKPVHTES